MKKITNTKALMVTSTSGELNREATSPIHSFTQGIKREHHKTSLTGIYNNENGIIRLSKIDFSRFDGEKVNEWCVRLNSYFTSITFLRNQK